MNQTNRNDRDATTRRSEQGSEGQGEPTQGAREEHAQGAAAGVGETPGQARPTGSETGAIIPHEDTSLVIGSQTATPLQGVTAAPPATSEEAPRKKQRRGFAAMDPAKQREIASKGGKASHERGTGHEWDSEAAREAGRKGGLASRGGRGKLRTPESGTPGSTSTPSGTGSPSTPSGT